MRDTDGFTRALTATVVVLALLGLPVWLIDRSPTADSLAPKAEKRIAAPKADPDKPREPFANDPVLSLRIDTTSPKEAPSCEQTWRTDARLPKDYHGCFRGGSLVVNRTFECFAVYIPQPDEVWWAKLGTPISNDPVTITDLAKLAKKACR